MAGPRGWSTSCRCHLNWAQYQMKSQHGRHDVGQTSVEGKEICCPKKTHKLMKNEIYTFCQSQRLRQWPDR